MVARSRRDASETDARALTLLDDLGLALPHRASGGGVGQRHLQDVGDLPRAARAGAVLELPARLLERDVGGRRQRIEQGAGLALQLGGSEPAELAQCARLGEQWGYDEINLNCGCPSDRVQRGAFGACLMNEPKTVADGVKAMLDVVDIPVTVKHRIGIDRIESYDFVRDFVGTVSDAGCQVFIVHARNAWLQGLSPKQNREVPPLRYELVWQLKHDFPHLTFAVNGGITTNEAIESHLTHVDGVMLGREAYYNPWLMHDWDSRYYGAPARALTREAVELAMVDYMERAAAEDGCPWYAIARHMLGLRHGLRGSRYWRQIWSNHKLKPLPPREVWAMAQAHVEPL